MKGCAGGSLLSIFSVSLGPNVYRPIDITPSDNRRYRENAFVDIAGPKLITKHNVATLADDSEE